MIQGNPQDVRLEKQTLSEMGFDQLLIEYDKYPVDDPRRELITDAVFARTGKLWGDKRDVSFRALKAKV